MRFVTQSLLINQSRTLDTSPRWMVNDKMADCCFCHSQMPLHCVMLIPVKLNVLRDFLLHLAQVDAILLNLQSVYLNSEVMIPRSVVLYGFPSAVVSVLSCVLHYSAWCSVWENLGPIGLMFPADLCLARSGASMMPPKSQTHPFTSVLLRNSLPSGLPMTTMMWEKGGRERSVVRYSVWGR